MMGGEQELTPFSSITTMTICPPPTSWSLQRLRQALTNGAVAYVGYLAELSHDELAELVEQQGGRLVSSPRAASLILLGAAGLPLTPTGMPINFSGAIVICEQRLIDLLHGDDHGHWLYSADALAEILGIPPARVQAWATAGLIKPRLVDHDIPRFDFASASIARTLFDLLTSGVSIDQLRRTLEPMHDNIPQADDALAQLAILEHRAAFLAECEHTEPDQENGQLLMRFQLSTMSDAPVDAPADNWHARAIDYEQAGSIAQAEQCYRQALSRNPDNPVIMFDLAHLLAESGRITDAIASYRKVISADPSRADAWNNLGVLLADRCDTSGAIDAFLHALKLNPTDINAIYNLADTLHDAGRCAEAAPHWDTFMQLSPESSPHREFASQCRLQK